MKLRNSSCTLFAAAALALAGCGDSDTTTTYTNPVPDLLITMGEQSRKASGAKGSADMSIKDATPKATMLSAVKVKGESSVAEANAQAILDAKAKVDSALTDANAALTALQQAKTEADALPADTPKLEELKTELATAITEATRNRDAIQAIKDAKGNDSLAKLVEKVTGANGKRTPADIAAAVAVEVEKAMVFQTGKGGSTYPPITGGITPTKRTNYDIVSDRPSADLSTIPKLAELGEFVVYNLPGVRLEQTDYASYGYWLGIPREQNAILGLYIFGLPNDMRSGSIVGNITATDIDGDMGKATYTGSALGMSVLTARDGRNRKAIKSGEFEALVKLTATFGASPTVKGTISEFKGEAVDPDNWSIELVDVTLKNTSPSVAGDLGLIRVDDAPDGRWYGRSHSGTNAKRPMAISGSFRAFFPNGRAVGGYTTVKDN